MVLDFNPLTYSDNVIFFMEENTKSSGFKFEKDKCSIIVRDGDNWVRFSADDIIQFEGAFYPSYLATTNDIDLYWSQNSDYLKFYEVETLGEEGEFKQRLIFKALPIEI